MSHTYLETHAYIYECTHLLCIMFIYYLFIYYYEENLYDATQNQIVQDYRITYVFGRMMRKCHDKTN